MGAVKTEQLHHTASAATQTAFERILSNVKIISQTPIAKDFVQPAQTTLKSLHDYAFNENEPSEEQKTILGQSFQELGIKVADSLRAYRGIIGSNYSKFIERCADGMDRVIGFLGLNQAGSKVKPLTIPDKLIEDLINFSVQHNGALIKQSSASVPSINFTLRRWVNEQDSIEVKEPVKLFQYINAAHQRNKLFNKPLDSKVKSLVYLAYCIKKHIESKGLHQISHNELQSKFGSPLNNIKKLAAEWNRDVTSIKRKSLISDYSKGPLQPRNATRLTKISK